MQVCQARPAEDWLRRASKVLQDVFSSDVYATLLKEAEQFLWGGSEMDRVSFEYLLERFCIYLIGWIMEKNFFFLFVTQVRDVAKSLIKAKIWAEAVGDCLSKVEGKGNNDTEKVHLEFIDELLKVDPVPCFQSGYLKLKVSLCT